MVVEADGETSRISFWKKHGVSAGDLLGGIAAAAVALPQSMGLGLVLFTAIGQSSSTGAMAGLLGAALFSLISGLVGATRGMVSAPNGPVTMLLVASLATLAAEGLQGPDLLLALSLILSMAGLMQIFFGIAGGGHLVKYIPFPAVAGLVTGIGILMILSQVKALGSSMLVDAEGLWRWTPVVVAAITLTCIKLTSKFVPRVPAVIGGFVAGLASYHLLALLVPISFPEAWVVGEIPSLQGNIEVPEFSALRSLPWLNIAAAALAVALLASVDCLLTAVVADGRTGARHNARRELATQGVAQIIVGLFGGLGGGGTKGSTLVAIASGGGRWAAGIAGLVFTSLLVFMGPLGHYLPVCVLAGVIIYVGVSMIDVNILGWIQRRRMRLDAIVALSVIAATLSFDLLTGLFVGMMGSALLFIRSQLILPVLHERASGAQRHSLRERSAAERQLLESNGDRIIYVELRGNLFFGTADRLYTQLMPDLERPVCMVINMRRVEYMDTTAMYIMRQMAGKLRRNGGTMVYANVFKHTGGVRKINKAFRQLGRTADLPKVKTFSSTDAALEFAENRVLKNLGWRMPVSGKRMTLEENNLCADLNPETIAALMRVLRPLNLDKKARVYTQGEYGDSVYLLLKGEVETRLPVGRYHYKRISKIGPGGSFGNLAFLQPGPRSTMAVVTRKSQMMVLDRASLETLEQSGEHKAAFRILESVVKTVSSQLRWARNELTRLEIG